MFEGNTLRFRGTASIVDNYYLVAQSSEQSTQPLTMSGASSQIPQHSLNVTCNEAVDDEHHPSPPLAVKTVMILQSRSISKTGKSQKKDFGPPQQCRVDWSERSSVAVQRIAEQGSHVPRAERLYNVNKILEVKSSGPEDLAKDDWMSAEEHICEEEIKKDPLEASPSSEDEEDEDNYQMGDGKVLCAKGYRLVTASSGVSAVPISHTLFGGSPAKVKAIQCTMCYAFSAHVESWKNKGTATQNKKSSHSCLCNTVEIVQTAFARGEQDGRLSSWTVLVGNTSEISSSKMIHKLKSFLKDRGKSLQVSSAEGCDQKERVEGDHSEGMHTHRPMRVDGELHGALYCSPGGQLMIGVLVSDSRSLYEEGRDMHVQDGCTVHTMVLTAAAGGFNLQTISINSDREGAFHLKTADWVRQRKLTSRDDPRVLHVHVSGVSATVESMRRTLKKSCFRCTLDVTLQEGKEYIVLMQQAQTDKVNHKQEEWRECLRVTLAHMKMPHHDIPVAETIVSEACNEERKAQDGGDETLCSVSDGEEGNRKEVSETGSAHLGLRASTVGVLRSVDITLWECSKSEIRQCLGHITFPVFQIDIAAELQGPQTYVMEQRKCCGKRGGAMIRLQPFFTY